MKRIPGKVIMVAIILSCGFVMQAEQSSEIKSKQANAEAVSRNVSFDQDPAGDTEGLTLKTHRDSW